MFGWGGWGGEELVGTDSTPTRHQLFWLILQSVLHVGKIQIQMVQLKCFYFPLPKEFFCDDSVTDINPKFPRPCLGIEIYIITSAFERFF